MIDYNELVDRVIEDTDKEIALIFKNNEDITKEKINIKDLVLKLIDYRETYMDDELSDTINRAIYKIDQIVGTDIERELYEEDQEALARLAQEDYEEYMQEEERSKYDEIDQLYEMPEDELRKIIDENDKIIEQNDKTIKQKEGTIRTLKKGFIGKILNQQDTIDAQEKKIKELEEVIRKQNSQKKEL